MSTRVPRLTSAHAIALLALFVALGGVGYAAVKVPRASVGSVQLRARSVTAAKLARNSVDSLRVNDGSLLASDFKAGQLAGGPQGPKGEAGRDGSDGRDGHDGHDGAPGSARAFATVLDDGTIQPGAKDLTAKRIQ